MNPPMLKMGCVEEAPPDVGLAQGELALAHLGVEVLVGKPKEKVKVRENIRMVFGKGHPHRKERFAFPMTVC